MGRDNLWVALVTGPKWAEWVTNEDRLLGGDDT